MDLSNRSTAPTLATAPTGMLWLPGRAGSAQVILLRNPFQPERQVISDPSMAPDAFIDNLTDLFTHFPPHRVKKTYRRHRTCRLGRLVIHHVGQAEFSLPG